MSLSAADLPIELTGLPSIVDYPPGSRYGPRTLDDFELVWLLQGNATWTCDDLSLDLPPGSLLLLQPGFHDAFQWDVTHTTRHAYVHFALRPPPGTDLTTWPLLRQLVPDDPLADLFRYLLWLGTATPAGWEPRARDALALLVALHVSGPLPTDDTTPVPAVIEHVIDYVRAQWSRGPVRAMPLAELAMAGAVSRVHLSRLFRERFGIGPVAAVELLRLTRAEGLLLRSNLTVAAVAAEVGFRDPYHFSRRFRAIYGMAPTAFRDLGSTTTPPAPALAADLAPLLQRLAGPAATSRPEAGSPSLLWLKPSAVSIRTSDTSSRRSQLTDAASIGSFVHETTEQRVVFGPGSRARVADEVAQLGAHRVMVIASHSAQAAAAEVEQALGDRCAAVSVGVRQHVPEDDVADARALASRVGADAIVTIGGGSATGLGKAVALGAAVPIVAVPTTYAGSEASDVYGITGNQKHTGRSREVLPRVIVYDPELTVNLPIGVTVTSAFNAIAHCVEGLYPGRDPVVGLSAEGAIRAYARALPMLTQDPADLVARTDALFAAYLSGLAFGAGGSGLHHKLCHVLGGLFAIDHGACHTVVLPYVAAYNADAAPETMRRVAAALRDQAILGLSPGDAAGALRDLARLVGAPLSLAELGVDIDEAGLDRAAELAVAATGDSNPRPPDVASVRALLDHAFVGDEPGPTGRP